MAHPNAANILAELRRRSIDTHGSGARRELIAYSIAARLLRSTLGDAWASRNLFRTARGDSFLERGSSDSDQRWLYQARVVNLGELLLNLALVQGARNRFERLQSVDLETAVAELEGAKLLSQAAIPFRFVAERGRLGHDFDVEVTPPTGPQIACEMKCKKIRTTCSESSFLSTVRKARRQLPRDSPGLLFLQIPESWFSPSEPTWLKSAIERVFTTSSRLAGLVLLSERWFRMPGGGRLSAMTVSISRNWTSPHLWDVSLHVLDRLESLRPGQNWIDLLQEADVKAA